MSTPTRRLKPVSITTRTIFEQEKPQSKTSTLNPPRRFYPEEEVISDKSSEELEEDEEEITPVIRRRTTKTLPDVHLVTLKNIAKLLDLPVSGSKRELAETISNRLMSI